MPSTGLRGTFPLTEIGIKDNVPQKSAGAYALGYTRDDTFYVQYIGRSDVDVAARLRYHIGDYFRFKFESYSTAKEAFEKECCLYHDFKPADNDRHPARPAGKNWECPVCDIFDD